MASEVHAPSPHAVPFGTRREASSVETEVNLAQLFRNRVAKFGDATCWRQKRGGQWISATWREYQAIVNSLISGLDQLGAVQGDIIGILGSTRWEWMATDWAIIGLGATGVMIYPSSVPATIAYITSNSGIRFLFADDYSQYEKLKLIQEQIPSVQKIILFEGAEKVASDPWVMSFETLRRLSSRTPAEADAFAVERAAAINAEDRCSIVYTSGTTGQPKGAIHTHSTVLAELVAVGIMLDTLRPGMTGVLFLPLSHVLGLTENLLAHDHGLEIVIVQSLFHVAEYLREIKSDLFLSVPLLYERVYAGILDKVKSGSALNRRIFWWAERIAREKSQLRQERKRILIGLRLRYAIADRLVFRKVRELFGGNLQFAVTGGAPLDFPILQFFDGVGVTLLEGWGLTETHAGFTLNTLDRYRLGSVGWVFPGHELRIADDGEILVRGPCVFHGYHNNPEATAEALDRDGWFHTGDIGSIDADGFVYIVDRKKDLIVTSGGKNVAPQHVENVLKALPCCSQAAVYGDRKPYLVALLTLDPAAVKDWADKAGLTYRDVTDVYNHPKFRAFMDERVREANATLVNYEKVRRYDILPDDFTIANDLLTPTLKIRRRYIHERYREQFEALYEQRKRKSTAGTDLA